MKKSSDLAAGRVIAVTLVLLFIGINFWKKDERGPQEKFLAQKRTTQIQNQKFGEKLAKTSNIEKLKFAYTGKWKKNDVKVEPGSYAFIAPESTRGKVQPTSLKKKKKKAKKKVAKKKSKKTKKLVKKFEKNIFDDHRYARDADQFNSPYIHSNRGFYNPVQPKRNPSDEEKEKKLTEKDWIELILKSGTIMELVAKYKGGAIGNMMFYSIVEKLLSSQEEELKKMGFQALEATPSAMSLSKLAKYLKSDMSRELKEFAQNTLQAYNKPVHLRALNSSLNSPNNEVRIIAANIIRNITTTILQSQANTGENVLYTEEQIKLYKTMLGQSLIVINSALEAGIDGSVLASFNSARVILVQFLG